MSTSITRSVGCETFSAFRYCGAPSSNAQGRIQGEDSLLATGVSDLGENKFSGENKLVKDSQEEVCTENLVALVDAPRPYWIMG